MFASPFDILQPREHTYPHRRARSPVAAVEPAINHSARERSHVFSLSAPPGWELGDVRASTPQRDIFVLSGELQQPRTLHEYIARRKCGIYAAPHTRSLVGVIPAGTVVRGGPPTHTGWIAIDDEDEAWILDDGSLALASAGRSGQSVRFRKQIKVPADAIISQATTQEVDGALVVTLPRKQLSAHARSPRAVPVKISKPSVAASMPPMPPKLTKEQLHDLQHECMADDINIEPAMLHWTEDDVRRFFESGGVERPRVPAACAPHVDASPEQPMTAPSKRAAPPVASSSKPPEAQAKNKKAARPRHTNKEANSYDALLPKEDPVLVECTASVMNVQLPLERSQEWEAIKGGGFVRTG